MNKVSTAFVGLAIFLISCTSNDSKQAEKIEPKKEDLQVIKSLEGEIGKNPDSAQLRMKLINVFDSLAMYPAALKQVDSLIARDSANNGLWFTKAQLHESNRDTAAALRSYEQALNIYPSVETQFSFANLLAETGNKQALYIVANIAKMGLGRETDAHCDFIAGVHNARTGNKQQAIMLFDRCINNNYTYMEAYMEKGFIFYDTKKTGEALKVFEQAITVQNNYADAWYWKAKCLEALGKKEEAIDNYKKSLSLDKGLKEAREAIDRLD